MALARTDLVAPTASERVRATAELLERRGYALSAGRLGEICLGGALGVHEVRRAVASSPDMVDIEGLVLSRRLAERAPAIAGRAARHGASAEVYTPVALEFIRRFVAAAPFVISVSIAGSLASGGFDLADDVDLNLVVEDGYKHQAYVVLNVLGLLHALRYRGKPVDDLSRRPLAPRLMTANLVTERSDWTPLARQDAGMAFELLVQEPVFGQDFLAGALAANPALLELFPQLAGRRGRWAVTVDRRAPRWLYPRLLESPARLLGERAWRYMMWTRRHRPDALRRVELVRSTMRPYTLFDRGPAI
ncbi:MAG TPA: hypothetical protein VF137_01350 [Candidatus Dormibacteraeota bacterium]